MPSLAAEIRTSDTGKTTARKIRNEGKIPAVIYGGGLPAVSLNIDPQAIVDVFRKTGDRNTVISLDFSGGTVPDAIKTAWADTGALSTDGTVKCLVRDVQRHPLRRDLLHVDFFWLAPGQEVEVMVPLEGVGRAKGMAIGGRLRLIRREVRVRCAWEDLPSSIKYDITHMNIGDMVKASELTLPEGVRLVAKNDFNVMTVYGKRVSARAAGGDDKKKK